MEEVEEMEEVEAEETQQKEATISTYGNFRSMFGQRSQGSLTMMDGREEKNSREKKERLLSQN